MDHVRRFVRRVVSEIDCAAVRIGLPCHPILVVKSEGCRLGVEVRRACQAVDDIVSIAPTR